MMKLPKDASCLPNWKTSSANHDAAQTQRHSWASGSFQLRSGREQANFNSSCASNKNRIGRYYKQDIMHRITKHLAMSSLYCCSHWSWHGMLNGAIN